MSNKNLGLTFVGIGALLIALFFLSVGSWIDVSPIIAIGSVSIGALLLLIGWMLSRNRK
jgi:hypothetical protein